MLQGKYTLGFEGRIILEILQEEQELDVIAVENNLNPNMVRNWKFEFLENVSSVFEKRSKFDRETKQKKDTTRKERDKMLKTIEHLIVERNFL